MAILHGMKLKDQENIPTKGSGDTYNGDPASCFDMSVEEKEVLTQELIAKDQEMFKNIGLAKKG